MHRYTSSLLLLVATLAACSKPTPEVQCDRALAGMIEVGGGFAAGLGDATGTAKASDLGRCLIAHKDDPTACGGDPDEVARMREGLASMRAQCLAWPEDVRACWADRAIFTDACTNALMRSEGYVIDDDDVPVGPPLRATITVPRPPEVRSQRPERIVLSSGVPRIFWDGRWFEIRAQEAVLLPVDTHYDWPAIPDAVAGAPADHSVVAQLAGGDVITDDGDLHRYTSDGTLKWKASVDGLGSATLQGDVLFVVSAALDQAPVLRAVAVDDGRTRWRVVLPMADTGFTNPTVVTDGTTLWALVGTTVFVLDLAAR